MADGFVGRFRASLTHQSARTRLLTGRLALDSSGRPFADAPDGAPILKSPIIHTVSTDSTAVR